MARNFKSPSRVGALAPRRSGRWLRVRFSFASRSIRRLILHTKTDSGCCESDCGFGNSRRRVQHNDNINDKILAESSRSTVCRRRLTGHPKRRVFRGWVRFSPWTHRGVDMRESDFDKAHFDTRPTTTSCGRQFRTPSKIERANSGDGPWEPTLL